MKKLLPVGFLLLTLLLTLVTSRSVAGEIREALIGEPDTAAMATALARLETFKNSDPDKNKNAEKRLMRVLYWTPADRDPQPQHRERLTRVLRHIQNFYAREMARNGLGEKTINLDFAADGLLNLLVVKGTRLDKNCSESDHQTRTDIRNDCLRELQKNGIDGNRESLVIFCNLADWDAGKRTLSHHSPYCASGNPRGGTAWQVDSELLDADLLGEKGEFLQDRQYGKISLGKYNSIFIGGACHEIGHLLGLPHCNEPRGAFEKFGTALMGSGNRTYGEELRGESKGSYLTRAHALKLATHPQFSGTTRQLNDEFTANFSDLTFTSNEKALHVTGKVSAKLSLLTMLFYADPEGNGDYDSMIGAGIIGDDGSFAIDVPHPKKNNVPAKLFFVPISLNGAAPAYSWILSAFSLSTTTDEQCRLDVEKLKAAFKTSTKKSAK